jgi:hypothetical protein
VIHRTHLLSLRQHDTLTQFSPFLLVEGGDPLPLTAVPTDSSELDRIVADMESARTGIGKGYSIEVDVIEVDHLVTIQTEKVMMAIRVWIVAD